MASLGLHEEFGISVSDDTIYRALKDLGFLHLSARPKAARHTGRSVVVSQHLPIYPADLCRLGPRGSFERRRNRQQPSRLRDVLRLFRKPANLARRIVRPHRNSLAHGKALDCHLESQHC
jgi:hypothetical protein